MAFSSRSIECHVADIQIVHAIAYENHEQRLQNGTALDNHIFATLNRVCVFFALKICLLISLVQHLFQSRM